MQPEARAVLRYTSSNQNQHPAPTLPLPTTRPGPPPSSAADAEWDTLPAFDEWALRPASSTSPSDSITSTIPPPPPSRTLPFTFSIQRTHQQNWRSFINGTSWEVPPGGEAAGVADVARVLAFAFGGAKDKGVEEGVKTWPVCVFFSFLDYFYFPANAHTGTS